MKPEQLFCIWYPAHQVGQLTGHLCLNLFFSVEAHPTRAVYNILKEREKDVLL
jgi:hypothetical protein